MAANKPTKPRKYKQARKDAKSAAKEAFSGKRKANLKDSKLKLSADDKMVLDEVKNSAKADLGKNAYLSKAEYNEQQRASREAFREKMRAEFGEYGGKTATPAETKTFKPRSTKPSAKEKPMPKKPGKNYGKYGKTDEYQIEKNLEREAKAGKKVGITKPATKGYAAGKELNATGKARYDALIKEGVAPKKALNKALFAQEKKSAAKPATGNTSMSPRQEAALQRRVDKTDKKLLKIKARDPKKFAAREKIATDTKLTSQQKANALSKIGPSPKLKPATPTMSKSAQLRQAKKAMDSIEKSITKAPKYVQSQRVAGKELAIRPKAGAAVAQTAAKTAAKKGLLRTAAGIAGKAVGGKVGLAITAATLLGKPVLTALVKEPEGAKKKKPTTATGARKKVIAPGHMSSNQTPKPTRLPASHMASTKFNKTIIGSGGSTYTVKKGDTLSGIAKTAGVSLADVRSANPKFTQNAKYNKGNTIFAGTKVKLPTKKK